MNPACAQSQIRPTLGAPRPWTTTGNATAQRKARSAHRCPPRHDPTLTRRTYFSFCGGPIHARLTNPAKQNIIPSIRGSKRQVADIKSEPRPASNRNQWPASFWNAWPASSESTVRVPRSAPRRDSRLECGDNSVGEFLVVVASLCGMASEVSHLAAPRNGIVPETASRPSHGGRRGKGAPAGRERLAKRLDRPNPCGDGRLCEIGLFQSCFMWLHRPHSSSWVNKRSVLRAIWKARKSPLPQRALNRLTARS